MWLSSGTLARDAERSHCADQSRTRCQMRLSSAAAHWGATLGEANALPSAPNASTHRAVWPLGTINRDRSFNRPTLVSRSSTSVGKRQFFECGLDVSC